jgi:hypothetical protein
MGVGPDPEPHLDLDHHNTPDRPRPCSLLAPADTKGDVHL